MVSFHAISQILARESEACADLTVVPGRSTAFLNPGALAGVG